jgi:hypothetical protein
VHWPINLDEEGVLVEVVDAVVEAVGAVVELLTDHQEVDQEDVVDEEVHVLDVKRKRKNGSLLPNWVVWSRKDTLNRLKKFTSSLFPSRSTK